MIPDNQPRTYWSLEELDYRAQAGYLGASFQEENSLSLLPGILMPSTLLLNIRSLAKRRD